MNDLMEIDLRIIGPTESETRCRTIREGDIVRVGRSPAAGIKIPWDRRISREQADFYFDGRQLHISCLADARNPILWEKRAYRKVSLVVGDEFRIGDTRFTLRESADSTRDSLNEQFEAGVPEAVIESSYSPCELGKSSLGDPDRQLEIVANLPAMIATAQTDQELVELIVPRLLDGIPSADGAAIAQFDDAWLESTAGPEVLTRPVTIRVATRAGFEGRFRPSRRLILKAFREQKSLVHIWQNNEGGARFTLSDGMEWACCVPFPDEACRGWCIFITGRLAQVSTSDESIRGDVHFTELVARFISATRRIRQFEDQKTRLQTTFSPIVVRSLTANNAAEIPTPAEQETTTLYCDIDVHAGPGSWNVVEHPAAESPGPSQSFESLHEILNIVVGGILDREGAIADFRTDSALGLWGWPVRLAEGPIAACLAGLDIARSVSGGHADGGRGIERVSLGIGIAHGPAIAGPIGPSPQARIGAFGPAVSRGARLGRISRQFGVAICIDDVTASWVQSRLRRRDGRVRRLARVRLGEHEAPINIYSLLPPHAEEPSVTDDMIVQQDSALDAIEDGHWKEARSILAQMPPGDGPTRFLLSKMTETSFVPPASWDGAFSLP